MDRATPIVLPDPAGWDDDRDQIVLLRDVPWGQYEALLRARGEAPRPLIAFLDGELELVTTSTRHEFIKTMARRLLDVYALERDVPLNGFGHATRKRKAKQAGAEPDEWYKLGTRGGWAPDLVIEVVHTSGGVDKLEIYRRFGVREVWFWIDDRFHVFRLVGGKYRTYAKSVEVPGIDLDELARIIKSTPELGQIPALRRYLRSLRRRRH